MKDKKMGKGLKKPMKIKKYMIMDVLNDEFAEDLRPDFPYLTINPHN